MPVALGRQYFREEKGVDGVDQNIGEDDSQGGKHTKLREGRETGQEKKGEADGGRQHSQQAKGPDLLGHLNTAGFIGTVEKQEVGDAVIDGEGNDRPSEPDGQDGNGFLE